MSMGGLTTMLGYPIHVSPILPMEPSPGEIARRTVRHGLADVLDWLGERVGPKPHAQVNAIWVGDALFVSQSLADTLPESGSVTTLDFHATTEGTD